MHPSSFVYTIHFILASNCLEVEHIQFGLACLMYYHYYFILAAISPGTPTVLTKIMFIIMLLVLCKRMVAVTSMSLQLIYVAVCKVDCMDGVGKLC